MEESQTGSERKKLIKTPSIHSCRSVNAVRIHLCTVHEMGRLRGARLYKTDRARDFDHEQVSVASHY